MLFSVVIPTYKDWERLEKCVNSLIDAGNDRFEFEIIIVNNEGSHNPPDRFKKLDRVQLIHEPAPGSYAARNRGAKIAKSKYLAFTDADCIPDKEWLENAQNIFENNICDLIGGRIDIFREENGSRWAYIYEKHNAFPQSRNVPKGRCVTANLLIKRDLFEILGGFDSEMKSGGDWEFSKRAVQAGYKLCYADDVGVRHPARSSISAILKKQKRLTSWGYIKVKKRLGYSGPRILASNILSGLQEIFDRTRTPDSFYEKWVILVISALLYFYKIIWLTAIVSRISDPEQVRE